MHTLDVEFDSGDIFHDWVQTPNGPQIAQEILADDPSVISIAVRDADTRKLVKIFDYRDTEENLNPFGYDEAQEG